MGEKARLDPSALALERAWSGLGEYPESSWLSVLVVCNQKTELELGGWQLEDEEELAPAREEAGTAPQSAPATFNAVLASERRRRAPRAWSPSAGRALVLGAADSFAGGSEE